MECCSAVLAAFNVPGEAGHFFGPGLGLHCDNPWRSDRCQASQQTSLHYLAEGFRVQVCRASVTLSEKGLGVWGSG